MGVQHVRAAGGAVDGRRSCGQYRLPSAGPPAGEDALNWKPPVSEWEFSTYGLQVVQLMEDDPVDRIDPMSRIFPKVTKCTFRKYVDQSILKTHRGINRTLSRNCNCLNTVEHCSENPIF
jgi:hypothetical protein